MKRLALSCLAAAALAVAAPAGADAAVKKYVAFGDSYASGPGLAVRDAGCGRSTQNYPSVIAQTRGYGAEYSGDWVDYSCTGATTGVGRSSGESWGGLTDQVQTWAVNQGVLGDATELVTISIGGNDAWRAANPGVVSPYDALVRCAEITWSCDTDATVIKPSDITAAKYQAWIYANVKKIHDLAKNAKILITSYPGIVPKAGQTTCSGGPWWAPWQYTSTGELNHLHSLLTKLRTEQTAAAATIESLLDQTRATPTLPDAIVRVVDLYTPSNLHDLCRPTFADRWVDQAGTATALHPTANGMSAFAAQVITKYGTSF